MAATETAGLKIAFPPDGALIDLGLKEGARNASLALKALGGAPPFTWFVNGEPVGEADRRRQSAWKPDGAGFARVSVIDAAAPRIRSWCGWSEGSRTRPCNPIGARQFVPGGADRSRPASSKCASALRKPCI